MEFIPTLLAGIAFPAPPTLAGWFVWACLLAAVAYVLNRWRGYQPAWKGREWGLFVFFLVLIPATALFIGLRLTSASARPLPGVPADAPGSALMIFSAIPWLLGGGLLIGLPLAEGFKGRAKDITKAAESFGLMLLIAGPDVIRFAPALIVSDAQIAEADRILRAAVDNVLAAE